MKTNSSFVHGGGWIRREVIGRPKARFFGFLSVVWLLVSVCASIPFWCPWPQRVTDLDWLCVLLIAPHPVFIVLALVFRLTERPRTIVQRRVHPDCDARNLY